MDQVFRDILNVHCIADDVMTATLTLKQHYHVLHTVMKTYLESVVHHHADKCHVEQNLVKFFGSILSINAHCLDFAKIKAIQQLILPENNSEH